MLPQFIFVVPASASGTKPTSAGDILLDYDGQWQRATGDSFRLRL